MLTNRTAPPDQTGHAVVAFDVRRQAEFGGRKTLLQPGGQRGLGDVVPWVLLQLSGQVTAWAPSTAATHAAA